MIDKINNQDMQIPSNINDLIMRYGLDKLEGKLEELKILKEKLNADEERTNTYYIINSDRSNIWYKLGTLELEEQCDVAIFDIYCGVGQNGMAEQNTIIQIMIKRSFDGNYPQWAGVTYNIFKMLSSEQVNEIRVIALSNELGKVDIWVYFPWAYSGSKYMLRGNYKSFNMSTEESTSQPSYGTSQNVAGGIIPWSTQIQ